MVASRLSGLLALACKCGRGMECGMLTREPNPVGTVPFAGEIRSLPPPSRSPPPACGQEAGPRTRLLLKVAERGGGRQVHGTRQWGCLNFRGRLNSRLSPLPPVIGDLAAEGGGGKGTGETRERASVARGQVLGGPGANFCSPPLALEERLLHVEMGAGGGRGAAFLAAAGASPNGPRGAAAGPGVGGFGGGDARPAAPAPREPRTKPAARGRPPRPRLGNGPKPVAVPVPIPAGGRRRLFVGSAPPSLPDGFL